MLTISGLVVPCIQTVEEEIVGYIGGFCKVVYKDLDVGLDRINYSGGVSW